MRTPVQALSRETGHSIEEIEQTLSTAQQEGFNRRLNGWFMTRPGMLYAGFTSLNATFFIASLGEFTANGIIAGLAGAGWVAMERRVNKFHEDFSQAIDNAKTSQSIDRADTPAEAPETIDP